MNGAVLQETGIATATEIVIAVEIDTAMVAAAEELAAGRSSDKRSCSALCCYLFAIDDPDQ